VNGVTRIGPLKLTLSLVLLCASSTGSAAETTPSSEEAAQDLDDILVYGAKKNRDPDDILAWLQRLVGDHAYSGHVELGGEGAPGRRRSVGGAGKCGLVGNGLVVQCAIQVLWRDITAEDGTALPGGVSTLTPAVIMYGIDMNNLGIRSQMVDSLGMANGGLGYLYGDTLVTTTDCVDLPGNCKRIARVSAQPDGKQVQMDIEIQRDLARIAHYVFELRRVEDAEAMEEDDQ
jgi:hypothetical protein